MFKNISDLSYTRTFPQAAGFYVFYMIVTIIGGMIAAYLLALPIGRLNDYNFGVQIGAFFALIFTVALSFLIVKKKNLLASNLYVALILLAGIAAYFGGGLLGLLVASFLTTRKAKE